MKNTLTAALLGLTLCASAQTLSGNPNPLLVGKIVTAMSVPMVQSPVGPVRGLGYAWAAGGTLNTLDAALNYEATPFRKEVPALVTSFLAGVANGVAEELQHHPDEFLNTFENANPDFWNAPELTWRNKYMNGDPTQGEAFFGSTTVFAAFTDGYHTAVGARTLLLATSISLSGTGGGWKGFLKRTAAHSLSYTIGFETTSRIIK